MRFIELFAGIGGFRYGLEKVGQFQSLLGESEDSGNIKASTNTGRSKFTCVWANEIDKYASQIYRKNFGGGDGQELCVKNKGQEVPRIGDTEGQCSEQPNTSPKGFNGYYDKRSKLYEGDITKISTKDIPDHDLLVGGFPCQAFSIAGKRGGFDDTRGTLFFDVARILRDKRPGRVVLENVKGLLSHDSGKTFQTILKTLTDIGYRVEWQVLNSKDFGVPQNRERVFIIGHTRGQSGGQVFPIGGTNGKDIIVSGVLDTETWRKRHEQIRRIHSPEGLSPTLPTGTGGGVMTKVDLCPCLNANDNRKGYTGQARQFFNKTKMVRRLTPTECERLQGFPDGWTEGISDTQRYKCLGNAVSTPVITAIGEKLLEVQEK